MTSLSEMAYQLHIQLSPNAPYQPYAGWDATYWSRIEAQAALQRARQVGYHGVKIVSIGQGASDKKPLPLTITMRR